MEYDAIVVGGGIAGLTSAAYLSKQGYKVLVCEKEKKVGGLVNSFNFNGFIFDGGVRAIENSGIVMPMLRQLGIEVEFLKNDISIGIEDNIIKLTSRDSIEDYKDLLSNNFKENIDDINNIISEIKRIMNYMDVLYGIDNPLFLDIKNDKKYLVKTILPWIIKYIVTINKIVKLDKPVDEYLKKFTENKSIIDIVSQHFFKKTPTFFALSYFGLYLDYKYPKGGTGTIIDKMEEFILNNGGEIKRETEIYKVDSENKIVKELKENIFKYKKLIWASDLRKLYNSIELKNIKNKDIKHQIEEKKEEILDKKGGDSIITLYIAVNIDKGYFENICTEHLFYTPYKDGISFLEKSNIKENYINKEEIINWIKKYYKLTTYEISIPVMRDVNLAPSGKSGLIISTVIDYSLVKLIKNQGWYEEFKKISEECIIDILDKTIYKGLKDKIIDKFISTPLSIESITGNSYGAITGWAFTNDTIPVEDKMNKVMKSINTKIPNVFQVGQWVFSPLGLPIAVLTGKLAADKLMDKKGSE